MKVLVTTESRFDRLPDGTYWTTSTSSYAFWQRYLDVFDEVLVMGRVRDVPAAAPPAVRADGPRVSFAPLPHYLGPWEYAHKYFSIRRTVQSALRREAAVIVRAPGATAGMVVAALRGSGRPYAVEVVGDPLDVFAKGSVRSILRPLLRLWVPAGLRKQCAGACAAAYVTAASLQKRYPASTASHVTAYSSIDLPAEAFTSQPREVRPEPGVSRIVFVGTLEQLYKAPDVLIDAVAIAIGKGAKLHLTIVGEGRHRHELEQRVRDRGLADHVRFTGHLTPGQTIWTELDQADLFVLPSHQEGLPRAMIEAMARGLPCIGSNVGGIPELLERSECVPAGNAQALAAKILEVLADPQRLAKLSQVNLHKAREYSAEILRPRRRALYQAVKDATSRRQAV
jgi:glycosyltransferase involved in cell wall biosynthesis